MEDWLCAIIEYPLHGDSKFPWYSRIWPCLLDWLIIIIGKVPFASFYLEASSYHVLRTIKIYTSSAFGVVIVGRLLSLTPRHSTDWIFLAAVTWNILFLAWVVCQIVGQDLELSYTIYNIEYEKRGRVLKFLKSWCTQGNLLAMFRR